MRELPIICNVEITHKCNFNCHICYNSRYNVPELTTNQFKYLFRSFAKEGCFYMHFSGGEPLLRPDFCELYKFCVDIGIKPSVESNASFVTKEHIELFKAYPPLILYVSIYSATLKTFLKTTRSNAKYFATVRKNILLLKELGINVFLRTPVSVFNYFELGEIHDYSVDIELPHSYSPLIWWSQTGKRLDHYRVTSAQISSIRRNHKVFEDLMEKVSKLEQGPFYARSCLVGINEFYVSPNGQMHLCHNFWNTKYDLMKGSFREAWNNWLPQFRKEEGEWCASKQLSPVGKCPYGEIYYDSNEDPSLTLEERLQLMGV